MKIVSYNYNEAFFLICNNLIYTHLYSSQLLISFSSRILYLSLLYCSFIFPLFSLDELLYLSQAFFVVSFFLPWCYLANKSLDIFIYIKKYMYKKIKRKTRELLKHLKMLQEFSAILNFNFIMIHIIHKVSLLLRISWIILKIILSNSFSRSIIKL